MCSFWCCCCYYLKFSRNWVSNSWGIYVVVVVFVLLLIMIIYCCCFYLKKLPIKFGLNWVSKFCCCCYCWSNKPSFNVWLKSGQEQLRYWWHWVCGGGGLKSFSCQTQLFSWVAVELGLWQNTTKIHDHWKSVPCGKYLWIKMPQNWLGKPPHPT